MGLHSRPSALAELADAGRYAMDLAYTALAVRIGIAQPTVRWLSSGSNTMAALYGDMTSFPAAIWAAFCVGNITPLAQAVAWALAWQIRER